MLLRTQHDKSDENEKKNTRNETNEKISVHRAENTAKRKNEICWMDK